MDGALGEERAAHEDQLAERARVHEEAVGTLKQEHAAILARLRGELSCAVGGWFVGTAEAVTDPPGFQALLEDIRHHLWLSSDFFWNVK